MDFRGRLIDTDRARHGADSRGGESALSRRCDPRGADDARIRDSVPVDEQLGLLPFKVNELAGFRVGGVVPGRAVMLSDAPADAPGPLDVRLEPHIFVAISPGAPMQTADRDAFARDVFATVPNLRDIRITTSEPLR